MKAGIEQARKDGRPHGRPMTAGKLVPEMKQLRKDRTSKRASPNTRGEPHLGDPVAAFQEVILGPFRSSGAGFLYTARLLISDLSPFRVAGTH